LLFPFHTVVLDPPGKFLVNTQEGVCMKGFLSAIAVLAMCFAVGAGPAHAGTYPHERNGFFIGFGLGWGNAGLDLNGVDNLDRQNSGSGNFRFGWAVSENLTLGLESSSWVKQWDIQGTGLDLKLTGTVTTFAVTYFPQNMGLYLRGGLGFSDGIVEVSGGGSSINQTETGLGLLGAVGYEWRLTQKFALGPQVEWAYLGIDSDAIKSADFVAFNAQATWYW
jgi:hypothetical protein